jgi:LAO/AO transport system kinase
MVDPRRDVERLARGVTAGDRLELARAITLVESERAKDRALAESLVEAVLPRGGESLRVAVSGAPGVGKSTLIDVLGRAAVDAGRTLAVLAVDPSSHVTGGSVLGDKTRMQKLAASPQSFIRPSPSGGVLGGVARRTREVIALCEAAGFDTVLVETVGVGQSEHEAAGLVDVFVLVVAPGLGDELQGMKRGILEVADVVAVNKADGVDRERAEQAALVLSNALGLFTRSMGTGTGAGAGTGAEKGARASTVPVVTLSALEERGVTELWSTVEACAAEAKTRGTFAARRAAGRLAWFRSELERTLRERWLASPGVAEKLADLEALVRSGSVAPGRAVRELFEAERAEG